MWESLFAEETFVVLKGIILFSMITLFVWSLLYRIDKIHREAIKTFMWMNVAMLVTALSYAVIEMVRVADVLDRWYLYLKYGTALVNALMVGVLNLARVGKYRIDEPSFNGSRYFIMPALTLIYYCTLTYVGFMSVVAWTLPMMFALALVSGLAIRQTFVHAVDSTTITEKLLLSTPFAIIIGGAVFRGATTLVDSINQVGVIHIFTVNQHVEDTFKYFIWVLFATSGYLNLLLMINLVQDQIEKITFLAKRDTLTKVWNRAALTEEIDSRLSNPTTSREVFSIILFDLDFFKKVNDTLGHIGGDAALVHAAKVAASCVRNTDMIGRYGGEEFVVVCRHTSTDGAVVVAEKIRSALESTPLIFNESPYKLTSSFGVTERKYNDTFSTIIDRADIALYQSKQNGRNKVTIFTEGIKG